MMCTIEELTPQDIEKIKLLFKSIFQAPPWNDDWSDEQQLHNYIYDLIGNPNSLTFAFYSKDELIGVSLGSIRHWYTGTQYLIDEFCISTKMQGHGFGTSFLKMIEERLVQKGIKNIFLQTNRNVPAFMFYKKNGFLELTDHVSLTKDI